MPASTRPRASLVHRHPSVLLIPLYSPVPFLVAWWPSLLLVQVLILVAPCTCGRRHIEHLRVHTDVGGADLPSPSLGLEQFLPSFPSTSLSGESSPAFISGGGLILNLEEGRRRMLEKRVPLPLASRDKAPQGALTATKSLIFPVLHEERLRRRFL